MSNVIQLSDYRKRHTKQKDTISQLVCQQLSLGQLRAIRDGLADTCITWHDEKIYLDINDVFTEIASRGEE